MGCGNSKDAKPVTNNAVTATTKPGPGANTATSSGQQPAAKPAAQQPQGATAKPAAQTAPSADPEYDAQIKTFGYVYARLTIAKTKTVFAAICAEGNTVEVCALLQTTGDVFHVTHAEAELVPKKDSLNTNWASFFKLMKTVSRKGVIKEQEPTDLLTLVIPTEKSHLSFGLKHRGKDAAILHRIFLMPLCRLYHKTKTSGDDSKYVKIEVDTVIKQVSIKEHEEKVASLQAQVEPLSKNCKQLVADARAAREEYNSIKKRIRRLQNANNNKDRDYLYAEGAQLYLLHTPHAKEHIPKVIPANGGAIRLIAEKYGADVSAFPSPSAADSANADKIAKALTKLDEWDFDVFALQTLANGGALFLVAFDLLHKYGLVKHFNLNPKTVVSFLQAIESNYHPNPFHNATHAADVMHITHFIVEQGGLKQVINMTPNDCLATLLAALIHDYDHPGLNNNFHIRTNAWLSLLYNDRSVLENHSLSQTLEMMKNPKFNLLAPIAPDQVKDIRETMTEMILSTDMGSHARIYQTFKRRVGEEKEWTSKDDQRLAMSVALKMADISNCCRPVALYEQWASNIAAEFYEQGDTEARLNLMVSPFFDRRKGKPDAVKGQLLFMNNIALPLFEAGAQLLPKLAFTVEQGKKNRDSMVAAQQKQQQTAESS